MTEFSLRLISNEEELQEALMKVDNLSDCYSKGDLKVKNELDIISLIIEEYENKTWENIMLTPNQFLMDFLIETGRSQQDLAKVLGAQSRASDILSGKRELSKSQIVRLYQAWGLPPAILLGIHYKQANIHEVSVNVIDATAILLNRITLLAVVGGNEVTNPFMVTEVYVQQDDIWKLASLSFTKLLTPQVTFIT